MQAVFKALPEGLNADIVIENEELMMVSLKVDELWSFVGNKKKPTMALACDGCKNSANSRLSSRKTLERNRRGFNGKGAPGDKKLFYTDYFSTYFEVIPRDQHRPIGKQSGKTNYIERFIPLVIQESAFRRD